MIAISVGDSVADCGKIAGLVLRIAVVQFVTLDLRVRGKSVAITWQEHGKDVARAWQEHGNNVATTWQEHGKNMARAGPLLSRQRL